MASKKKNPTRRSSDLLAKMGLSFTDSGDDDDADDEALESELQLLLSGNSNPKPKTAKKSATIGNLDKMVAECMRNPSIDDEDEDVSEDEALLAELNSLTKDEDFHQSDVIIDNDQSPKRSESSVLNILYDRLSLYKQAEQASKSIGDSAKTRRFGRAIKTLDNLISSAKAGHSIHEDDIPPVVPIPKAKTVITDSSQNSLVQPDVPSTRPSRPAPQLPFKNIVAESTETSSIESPTPSPVPLVPPRSTSQASKTDVPSEPIQNKLVDEVISRRNQYKIAALNAKKLNDMETAMNYVKIAKKFDVVIEAIKKGESVDLSDMPPPPLTKSSSSSNQTTASKIPTESVPNTEYMADMEAAAMAAANEPEDRNMFDAPEPPSTILEALEQRLHKYCSTRDAAKNEGNSGKARRLQRIVQQYEEAIKRHKAGKVVAFGELPTPPGFAPIPVSGVSDSNTKPNSELKIPVKPPSTNITPIPSPATNQVEAGTSKDTQRPLTGKHPKVQRTGTLTILEKQLNYLLERQKLFRQAALESKRNGDIQQAKHYLSMSKGFDSMIEATKCGLPIDASSIPTPPQLESDFVIISESDCVEEGKQGAELYPSLVEQLRHQIEMCTKNKEHFMNLGDVSSASKFEKLCLDTKKDLALIQYSWENGEQIPSFRYETRLFSLVQCNTDLADTEIEVIVERGVNLPGKPDDLDAYVKIEFPIPQDAPQKAKTRTVKDTNNPEFHENFKFSINRKSRSQLRQFKRQAVKFEVWSKGGFFRSDFILGTVMVKLMDLETKCSIHNSFDLMEGRKICGGKLEIKLRIRDPLLSKQVEEVKEKWLIIGS